MVICCENFHFHVSVWYFRFCLYIHFKMFINFFFLALFESWLWCLQLVWWNLWNICGFGKKNLILWIGIRKYVKCTLWLTSKTRHYWGQEGKMIQMYKLQILIREARALLKDLPGNCPVSSYGNFPLCSYAFYMYLQMEHFINALHRLWYVENHAVGHWLCVADFYWGGDSLEELS